MHHNFVLHVFTYQDALPISIATDTLFRGCLLMLLSSSLTTTVSARCAASNPSIRDNVEPNTYVVRVQLESLDGDDLPCPVRAYDPTEEGSMEYDSGLQSIRFWTSLRPKMEMPQLHQKICWKSVIRLGFCTAPILASGRICHIFYRTMSWRAFSHS